MIGHLLVGGYLLIDNFHQVCADFIAFKNANEITQTDLQIIDIIV